MLFNWGSASEQQLTLSENGSLTYFGGNIKVAGVGNSSFAGNVASAPPPKSNVACKR